MLSPRDLLSSTAVWRMQYTVPLSPYWFCAPRDGDNVWTTDLQVAGVRPEVLAKLPTLPGRPNSVQAITLSQHMMLAQLVRS